jgi:polyisoprenoid-binding protein YceI
MARGRFGACFILLSGLAGLGTDPVPKPPTPAAPEPDAAYLIDGAHSEARFIVSLRIGMRTEGRISKVSGELRGDAARGWQVLVVADGRSLVVKGPRWMDRATRSEQFLAVDTHPEIRFQSDLFSERLLHAGGRIRGQLGLRGLTRPVSFRLLPSACAHPGRDCDLQVNGTINRKQYGMTAHPVSVRDLVQLNMRVRLHPDPGGTK